MRVMILYAYFLLTLPIVTVWAAASLLAAPDEPLPFQSVCDSDGVLAQSLLLGFCSFSEGSNDALAGGCLKAKTYHAFAVIFNEIADEGLADYAPEARIAELGTDGCVPDEVEDALVTAYVDLRDRVMNKLMGF